MAKTDEINLIGVPYNVAKAFRRGLDDVKNNRVVSAEAAIAEGRRRVAAYRRASVKKAYGQAIQQR